MDYRGAKHYILTRLKAELSKIYGEQLQRIQTAQDSPERGRRPSDAPSGPLPPTSPAL